MVFHFSKIQYMCITSSSSSVSYIFMAIVCCVLYDLRWQFNVRDCERTEERRPNDSRTTRSLYTNGTQFSVQFINESTSSTLIIFKMMMVTTLWSIQYPKHKKTTVALSLYFLPIFFTCSYMTTMYSQVSQVNKQINKNE